MIDELLPLEAVSERDIDLLLHEELTVSADFSIWLLENIGISGQKPSVIKVWHSISDPDLGQSDLIMLAIIQDQRVAVLIENKIDAVPQPNQSSRYKERGQKGINNKDWDKFTTVILAPKNYLQNNSEAALYDAQISYESIVKWFSRNDNPRENYKADMLRQAIEQNRRGYNPIINQKITTFFRDYWQLASRYFPELNTEDPGPRTATSGWISFRPNNLPKQYKIWHKIEYNQVDLELPFAAEKVEFLRDKYSAQLPKDVQIVKRGRKAGLRINVPSMDRLSDFSEQEEMAFQAMKAAIRLSSLFYVLNES
ncbi:MAG TPA: PD-(D/E)XK nuclease family protein [Syntrophales bacterium]|nr:PD-(D/E)XK nuclease family protein [Syntrophales bacterium]